MSNVHDLSLLVEDTITIKFSEDKAFNIPADPSLQYTYKLLDYETKMKKAKDNKTRFDLLVQMVLDILNQDKENQIDKKFIIDNFSNSQMKAVIQIYQKQVVNNQNNPN